MAKTTGNAADAVAKIGEFNRFGSVLGLERIGELLKRLGNPEKDLKYIHIAGTNGKGSVSRFIYSALSANGYSVGIYTSPFLTVFNERIEVDGEYIPDEALAQLTDKVLVKVNEMVADDFDSPTEFEVITAIAFMYFAQKKCDYVVLEVGLGGKGDSTNVIEKPIVSVITSISYDHMDRLGNTLAEIAADKAGIIKPGVPVVANVSAREAAKEIARVAYEKGSVLYDVTRTKYRITKNDIDGITFTTALGETSYEDVTISMLGEHQVQNAVTALTALEIMRKNRDIKVERSKLYEGLKSAVNIGRFEVVKRPSVDFDAKAPKEMPHNDTAQAMSAFKGSQLLSESTAQYVVLDGAHNEAGAEALAKAMKTYFADKFAERKILVVTGMLRDKDTAKIIEHFSDIADCFIATEPDSDRKMDAAQLTELICGYKKDSNGDTVSSGIVCTSKGNADLCAGETGVAGKNRCIAIPDAAEATKYALENCGKGEFADCDTVLFAGSLYLIGKVRGIINA